MTLCDTLSFGAIKNVMCFVKLYIKVRFDLLICVLQILRIPYCQPTWMSVCGCYV